MLTDTEPRKLTVQHISAHLGRRVQSWNIVKALQDERLAGTKAKGVGTGHSGQGGRWMVKLPDYLDWLGVPQKDREAAGEDRLPELYPFAEAAETLGLTEQELTTLLLGHLLGYIQVGRERFLTRSQLAAARRHARKSTRQAA